MYDMKSRFITSRGITALLLCLLPLGLQAKLNVVTTLTDFAVVAEAIGGDEIKVTSLATGTEDPHYVDARPSFIRTLNRADLLIEGGADLEVGWLPALTSKARNRDILRGGKGRLNASFGIPIRDIPTQRLSRAQGHVHAKGNPHYMMSPANARIVAGNIAAIIKRLDPKIGTTVDSNLERFLNDVKKKEEEWAKRLAPYKGTKIVTYHSNFDYFAAQFGLNIVDTIEPKPGINPSPTDVQKLMQTMKAEGVKLILIEPIRSRRTPGKLAAQSNAKVVVLPFMADGTKKSSTYIGWIDECVSLIESALK